jgi:hypothetical protein
VFDHCLRHLHRMSIIARMDGDIAFDGFLVGRTPIGSGGATHLHFHLEQTMEIEEEYLNTIQEITPGNGTPAGPLDDDGDNLLDDPGDVSGTMQFSLDLPAGGSATLALDYVGGSLSNAAFASGAARLQPGDADQDLDFDQLDLVRVQVAAKYLTGQPATWGEGDWDGAPGGEQGAPPAGDGQFDQLDIIAALSGGYYLAGPYAAIAPEGQLTLVGSPQGGGGLGEVDAVYVPIPEPSACLLLLLGIVGLTARPGRWRK